MKRTMTKEGFNSFWRKSKGGSDGLYDALSEAGISFDIYTDSDGQIIKPGDECEFWDDDNIGINAHFIGVDPNSYEYKYCSDSGWFEHCRKLSAEVWEPVPQSDVKFGTEFERGFEADRTKWAKVRITDWKLEGVRK